MTFMGNIETVYHQVQILECHQSMLRFMWWESNNYNFNHPTNCQMCVSPLSCCNYRLITTTIDNKFQFGLELAKTRNFYVDDLLVSISDIQSTMNHIKTVTEIHKADGIKLGTFLSNITKVLKSLQKN